MSLDTATPAGSSGSTGIPARQPSPSAVTKADIAKAGATRRRKAAQWKLIVGTICTLLVIIPIILANVLPLPDANFQDLAARRR